MNSDKKKKTLLLVEDEVIIATFEKQQLEKSGYKVLHTFTGEDAITTTLDSNNIIDLILMDINLGKGIDGTEAARQILLKKHIPILFLTSHTEKEYVDRIKTITKYGYVLKNSGNFVLNASIEMAFELFGVNQNLQGHKIDLEKSNERLQKTIEELTKTNETLNFTQNELLNSRTMYKELFDNIKSGVAIYKVKDNGNDFEFIDFNKAGELIEGENKEELIGKSVYEVRPGIKEFGLDIVFKKVWESGKPEFIPIKHYKDHKISNYYENYIYRLPTGEIVAVFDDLTELKKANETAEENEEKFRFLFENMIQGVVFHNLEGKIIEANKSASEILGLQFNQIFGLTSYEPRWKSIHEDGSDYPGKNHPVFITLQTGQPVYNAKMGVFNPIKNSYVWLNINSLPKFKNNETKPYQVIVTFEDITELKNANKKVEESAKLLNSISDNLNNTMVYQIDSGEDGSQRKFTYISKTVESLHEASVEQVKKDPMTIYGQVFEDDIKLVKEKESIALKSMSTLSVEVRIQLPSGKIRKSIFTSTPRRLSNNHIVWDGIEMDITEQKKI